MKIGKKSRVVIVGAGIGGLVSALYLNRVGFSNVTLIESVNEIKPLGLGINVQPEAVRILYKLGLKPDLIKAGVPTSELRYLDQRGQLVWRQACGVSAGNEYPQYSIHRGEFQMLLLDAVWRYLGQDAVRTGIKILDVTQDSEKVLLDYMDQRTGGKGALEADFLIGADGIDSVTRSKLHPGSSPARWSSITMWRGATFMDRFLDGQTMTITYDQKWSRLVTYPISRPDSDNGKILVNWVCLVPVNKSHPDCLADWNKSGKLEEVLPYFDTGI